MKKYSIMGAILALLIVFSAMGENVCKFSSLLPPEKMKSITRVPSHTVAMDNYVFVSDSIGEQMKGASSSIFFVIDNSSSMYTPGGGGGSNDTTKETKDRWAARFSVTKALIDTFYKRNPMIEVGMAVFMRSLYHCKKDDSLVFDKYPTTPATSQASFIKLLKLNEKYQSTSQKETGYDILTHYLQLDTVTQMQNYKYARLKYTPSDINLQMGRNSGTNITYGFEAAKLAMEKSTCPKEKQFVIFYSDGEANQPDSLTIWKFKDGVGVPTTFSVFFSLADTVPQSIQIMTENIKKNGYSISNPLSNLWSIKTDHITLMKLLMENVIPKIFTEKTTMTPKDLNVNGSITSSNWKDKFFPFDHLFPLTGKQTDFTYKMTYKITVDSVLPNGEKIPKKVTDTTYEIKFTAEVQTDQTKDQVSIKNWGRKVGFFFKDAQINNATIDMDELEVRFSYYKV
ncbi:MAG: hypothetical protein JW795_01720, partial [Chitinivibrionales bacterium]|nr:hypothetical protein [Chitinivibrionales bacterium]